MVTLVKHEWHSHDRQYAFELDIDKLAEIYLDLKKKELKQLLKDIENGDADIDGIISDAWDNDVEIEWDFQYDDCYSDRKGGYDVTYELGDESSWVEPEREPEPTHKCSNCRWKGQKYETLTQYLREDGTVIEDYYNSEEQYKDTKEVCPMCDGEIELTEEGVKREEAWEKLRKELDEIELDDE